jgi:hypothetical protein
MSLRSETKEEAEALRKAKKRLEEAVEQIPDEDGLFESAQIDASPATEYSERDHEIRAQFHQMKDEIRAAQNEFLHALRAYQHKYTRVKKMGRHRERG